MLDSEIFTFPNDPQASLNNLPVVIQCPRLEANQWLRSFLLDPRLLLEVTPTVYMVPLKIINYFNKIVSWWNFPKHFLGSLEYMCPTLPCKI